MNAKLFEGTVAHVVTDFNQYIQVAGIAPGLIMDFRMNTVVLNDSEKSLGVEILLVHGKSDPTAGGRPIMKIAHGTPEHIPVVIRDMGRNLSERNTIWHRAHAVGVDDHGLRHHFYAIITYQD